MRFTTLRKYYNTLITNEHHTGDVWSNLPTHGLLKAAFLRELSLLLHVTWLSKKLKTLTYLPIMPVRMYLSSTSFLSEIRGQLLNLSDNISFSQCRDLLESNNQISPDDCDRLLDHLKSLKADGKATAQVSRCRSGLLHMKKTLSSHQCQPILRSSPNCSE